jgi:hypothetical protein
MYIRNPNVCNLALLTVDENTGMIKSSATSFHQIWNPTSNVTEIIILFSVRTLVLIMESYEKVGFEPFTVVGLKIDYTEQQPRRQQSSYEQVLKNHLKV